MGKSGPGPVKNFRPEQQQVRYRTCVGLDFRTGPVPEPVLDRSDLFVGFVSEDMARTRNFVQKSPVQWKHEKNLFPTNLGYV